MRSPIRKTRRPLKTPMHVPTRKGRPQWHLGLHRTKLAALMAGGDGTMLAKVTLWAD